MRHTNTQLHMGRPEARAKITFSGSLLRFLQPPIAAHYIRGQTYSDHKCLWGCHGDGDGTGDGGVGVGVGGSGLEAVTASSMNLTRRW